MAITEARKEYIVTNYGTENCVDENTYKKMADAEIADLEPFTYEEYTWARDNVGWCTTASPTPPLCLWITSIGGKNHVLSASITDAILGYKNVKDIGFAVKVADITGLILYYKGQMNAGDSMTGCS